jgi:small basic protein
MTTVTFSIPADLASYLYAIGWALAIGLSGYFDSVRTKNESFNSKMFLKTIITAIVIAFVEIYLGLDPVNGYLQAAAFVTTQPALTNLIDGIVNDLWGLKGSVKISVVPAVPKT